MKKLIILLLTLSIVLLASPQTFLKLDTQGHTGMINNIIVTKNGDIISASDDKTIRVWDSQTGLEKRKILGSIGVGDEGKIFAIALSEDERFLAVGGFLDKAGNGGSGNLRIYDYQTGKLLQVLKSHTNIVNDLAFKENYLISGSFDKTAKIWEMNKQFKLKDTVKFHTKEVYAVKIIKKDSLLFAVTASYDNKIVLYDIASQKIVASDSFNYKLNFLAINEEKKHIAVSGMGKEITIYNYNLDKIKTIESETKPTALSYDREGKTLLVGTSLNPYNVNIYSVEKNYKKTQSFQKHRNTTVAVTFLENDAGTFGVSGGGNNNEIYIWDVKSAEVKRKIVGSGNRVWSVGIRGSEVAWGNIFDVKGDYHIKQSSFQKSINLKTGKINEAKTASQFHRISTKNGMYQLSHSQGGDYGYSDAVLNVKKDGATVASIVKDATDGYLHRCYGWYKNYIISGGANGELKIYNKNGKEIASLIGHTGEVLSIAVDGDRLVSGGDDQTMKVWDLSELGSSSTLEAMLNIFVSKESEWVVWSKSGYFNSSVGGDKYVGYHINQGADREARYVGSDRYFDTLYRPDIIHATLETGSEKKAIAFAGKTKRVQDVDISNSLPPVVTLLSSSKLKTTKNSVTINYRVESKESIKESIILHNGEKLNARAVVRQNSKNSKSIRVELDDGENIISIKARNKFAMSDEILVYVTKTSKNIDIYKPTLYLLSVGVSQYENPEYNLGVADKDAEAMAKLFKKQEGKIYKKVFVKTLTNKKAHSDNILDGLDWIDKEATSKDVVMIFIAGHGVNDDKGNYYFLSHDANLDRLRRTALKWTEIQDTISNLPSKVILLADTCHSGNITGVRRDITSAIKSIINSGSGSIIMTATTGNGYSYERSEWGHGAFTKSFLDGLGKMKADHDKDGVVTLKEIDFFITNNVKKLTNGKQKPTTIVPQSIPDFAIGVE